MAYFTGRRDPSITANPRKTEGANVGMFIRDTCRFYQEASSITEDIYNKYVKYCDENHLEKSCFNVFARAFRYNIIHYQPIAGVGVIPVNYEAYKPHVGYVTKTGWAYTNLVVNY